MARKTDHGTLIHCPYCDEDYSATYKRCPFCGEKIDPYATGSIPPVSDEYEDDYVFEGGDVFDDEENSAAPARGGKRLNGGSPKPINWPRLVTFICSLIIIAAALVIVFSYIYPKIHNANADPGNSPATSQSQPVESEDPGTVETDEPSDPVETDDPGTTETDDPDPVETDEPDPSGSQEPVDTSVTGLKLSTEDFTLKANASHTIEATVSPSDWDGTITWTSSNENIAVVDKNGTVTNVNKSSEKRSATITATAGGKTATCIVRCSGGSSGNAASSGSTSSGDLKLNKSDFTLYVNGSASDKSTTMKVTSGDTNVTWSISDSSVATIDQNGKVTAVGAGNATITATASDGSTATCIVRVRES